MPALNRPIVNMVHVDDANWFAIIIAIANLWDLNREQGADRPPTAIELFNHVNYDENHEPRLNPTTGVILPLIPISIIEQVLADNPLEPVDDINLRNNEQFRYEQL
jgi:hypothetical protein